MKNPGYIFSLLFIIGQGLIVHSQTTNYKTGIDVLFQGTDGVDYTEEYWYHDRLIDDHKVVYIKSGTTISMAHNARNILYNAGSTITIGINGQDGIPNSGDEGVIRYKVDRELNYKLRYNTYGLQAGEYLPPSYTAPFSFNDLLYSNNVPVVGSTGDNGLPITDKSNYFTYGILDQFGDEWHSFAFWDDDAWYNQVDKMASDGKIIQFVINPKTPAIQFNPIGTKSQFYTTPAKTYYVPVIHDQVSYVTDSIEINLVNIMNGNPVFYRFDANNFTQYTGPISTTSLTVGSHTLEYYYDNAYHKFRTIIKNPSYPSDQDIFEDGTTHGYLLWENDQKYQQVKNRLLTGSLSASYTYKRNTNNIFGGNGHTEIDSKWHTGTRFGTSNNHALLNAIVVSMEGANTCPTHAEKAKKVLLDNCLALDILGAENKGSLMQIPYREREYRGYYDVNRIYDMAFAYDLLIKNYKATQFAGGITPIEDYKIRDLFASWVFEQMLAMGGYHVNASLTPSIFPNGGMWDVAKSSGALVAAMAMPSYNTSYFGTSGFNGSIATHTYTPYPNHPASWKDVFYTNTNKNNTSHVNKIYGYPDQQAMFNPFDGAIPLQGGLITHDTIQGFRILTTGDTVTSFPPGSFIDRIPYAEYSLMGHVLQIHANVTKLKFNRTYPVMEKLFDNANKGTLYGLKVSQNSDKDPVHLWQYILVNEYFPTLAPEAEAYLPMVPSPNFQFWTHPFGLIWYNPEWGNYLPYDTTVSKSICQGDSLLIGGAWQKTTGSYTDTLTAANAADSIVTTVLTIMPSYQSTLNTISICDGDSISIFGTYQHVAGIYYDSLKTITGCDSTINQQLTVIIIDTNVIKNNDTLTSQQSGAALYQWIDCNNNNVPIPGATNQTYYPSANGSYAVTISKDGCSDTSSCFNVVKSSIFKHASEVAIIIYPNPVDKKMVVSWGKLVKNGIIELQDITGKVVIQKKVSFADTTLIETEHLAKGVYFVRTYADEQISLFKIIRE